MSRKKTFLLFSAGVLFWEVIWFVSGLGGQFDQRDIYRLLYGLSGAAFALGLHWDVNGRQ